MYLARLIFALRGKRLKKTPKDALEGSVQDRLLEVAQRPFPSPAGLLLRSAGSERALKCTQGEHSVALMTLIKGVEVHPPN